MPDMLVKLYELSEVNETAIRLRAAGIEVRRAIVPEKWLVTQWVRAHFQEYWVSECEGAFARLPVSCFVAVQVEPSADPLRPKTTLLGFACYDATLKGFFGPTGVVTSERGRGIGKALLVACLQAMRQVGYGYAIIGGVGPAEFYSKAVGATLIEGSAPGIYKGMLRA